MKEIKSEKELVLEVGCEGGGGEIFRVWSNDEKWTFFSTGSSMYLDDNDDEAWKEWRSDPSESLIEALNEFISGDQLMFFHPVFVHPEYRSSVKNYLEKYYDSRKHKMYAPETWVACEQPLLNLRFARQGLLLDNIQTREANLADANLIAVLGSATFYEAYFEQDIPSALANYILESFSPEQIALELAEPGSEFFIIFRDEKAVGYAKLREDPPGPGVTSENTVELQRFYLVERVYGKGVAKALLDHVVDRSRERGFDTVWLGVWTENKRAQRFYEKHGFTDTGGRLEFVYDAGVGINIVMEKKLPNPR